MAYKILIVDDDLIFSNLLADVFKQAGYDVRSAASADEALGMAGGIDVDLIVTDQRMPGTSGMEFVRRLMENHKNLPVIMVSGFLSSDDIRHLIASGIGGVFIKPLNIFQLLKRVAQLIDRRENQRNPRTGDNGDGEDSRESLLNTFKGARSATAVTFLKQVESLRSFTSNLLLVGHEGTNFDVLCQDLSDHRSDTIFNLAPADLDNPDHLASRMAGLAQDGQGRLTIVLDKIEEVNPTRAEVIFSIARSKTPFDKLGQSVRFIFCLRAKLDDLFDAGKIDENLYLFMGTMELNVPSLADFPEDVPSIAQVILEGIPGATCRLDDQAIALLKDLEWPGETRQLEAVLAEAVSASSGQTIGADTIRAAYDGKLSSKEEVEIDELRDYLVRCRAEYADAMSILTGDENAAAKALGIDVSLVRAARDKAGTE